MLLLSTQIFSLLQRCMKTKDLSASRQVYSLMIRSGLDSNTFLAFHLIRLFSLCGSLMEANEVYLKFCRPDLHMWTAIISAHVKHQQCEQAIKLYHAMLQSNVKPNDYAYVAVLKACASPEALPQGRIIHADVVKAGYDSSVHVSNTLIDMYAKCGSLDEARRVFDQLRAKDIISWNAMISGYTQNGFGEEALHLLDQMRQEGIQADAFTYVSALKACGILGAIAKGKLIHVHIVECGLESNIFIGNTLIDMYAKCGSLETAHQVFETMPHKDLVSWNAMIAGYAQHGFSEKALQLFEYLQKEGIRPNRVTFVSILKACCSISAIDQAKQIHAQIIDAGLESDLFVGSTLVDMYSNCGSLVDARHVFNKFPARDVVLWNVMIAGYAKHGDSKEALNLFREMKSDHIQPDSVTYVCILQACASIPDIDEGKLIHTQVIERGLEGSVFVGNGLVDMYAKCGSIDEARKVFDRLPAKDVVSWNAMIAGYAQQGLGEQALHLFELMQQEDMKPNDATYLSILKACGSIAAIDQGKRIHAQIIKCGLETNVFVGSALVDMYSKCGDLNEANKVLIKLPVRNVVSWNAMISGHAQHGLGKEALQLYKEMQREGIKPDSATFVSLLSACSHANLTHEGFDLFHSMLDDHGIRPELQHYGCMVDLLSRRGSLSEAEKFVIKMPIVPSADIWMSVLAACKTHGNVELARRSFDSILKLEPSNDAAYVLMANIYAVAGRWVDSLEIRKTMKTAGIRKIPGCTWIEFNNQMHRFVVEDKDHPQKKRIYATLHTLIGRIKDQFGYEPDLSCVLYDVPDHKKAHLLSAHSEKLALTFGLINLPPGVPIRIVKNLRTCADCHTFAKMISKLSGREIIERDANRFHHFRDGVCSCGDYW
ncbi:hypothetical protein O6H91_14G082900 [Diphasiastrum complanatum]|uniref:Uncharacterized protein n=1 Tax=Diphasiastrum complanatum TaxID=34168 RepID=A0ACC2BS34_DIPCM|nr:hypothetical protein O6H91_14G082900 [Diphasiastrum complanatum]